VRGKSGRGSIFLEMKFDGNVGNEFFIDEGVEGVDKGEILINSTNKRTLAREFMMLKGRAEVGLDEGLC